MLRAIGDSQASEEGVGYASKAKEHPEDYARCVTLHRALWGICKNYTEINGLPSKSEFIRDAVWDLMEELEVISAALEDSELREEKELHTSSFYAPPVLREIILPFIKDSDKVIFNGMSEMVRFAILRWVLEHRDEIEGITQVHNLIGKTHYTLSAQEIQLIILRYCLLHKFVSAEDIAREIAASFGVDNTQRIYEKWIKEIKRRVHPNLRLLEKQKMIQKYSQFFFESLIFHP